MTYRRQSCLSFGITDLKTIMKYENTSDDELVRQVERLGAIEGNVLKKLD